MKIWQLLMVLIANILNMLLNYSDKDIKGVINTFKLLIIVSIY